MSPADRLMEVQEEMIGSGELLEGVVDLHDEHPE
jgi:hypothetical protein